MKIDSDRMCKNSASKIRQYWANPITLATSRPRRKRASGVVQVSRVSTAVIDRRTKFTVLLGFNNQVIGLCCDE